MLASRYRLKGKVNFARAEIDGKLFQSKSFGLEVFERKDNDSSRFGFIISTRISKKAVIRNKIKRIISSLLSQKIKSINKGLDVVFLIKPAITKLTKEQIEKETNEIITKNL
ncbi:MAG TPA: ribonuclease P protein component [Patescibacteria group bacterium]|nr:ribonuclease P protein component [Patescibacteria group bacterium]